MTFNLVGGIILAIIILALVMASVAASVMTIDDLKNPDRTWRQFDGDKRPRR